MSSQGFRFETQSTIHEFVYATHSRPTSDSRIRVGSGADVADDPSEASATLTSLPRRTSLAGMLKVVGSLSDDLRSVISMVFSCSWTRTSNAMNSARS